MPGAVLWTLDGEPVTPELARQRLRSGLLRVHSATAAIAPVRPDDIVEVDSVARLESGDIVLFEWQGTCRLARLADRSGEKWLVCSEGHDRSRVQEANVLGVVNHVESGDVVLDLRRSLWRVLGRWLALHPQGAARVLRALAILERLRRPLFPPLYLGTEEELTLQIRAAYEAEAGCWSRQEGLSSEEEIALRRYLRPGMRLLDVGCGGGREAIAFARSGIRVVGIDPVPALVEAARKRSEALGLDAVFQGSDVRALDAPTPFHAVYLSPGVYAHIPGRANRVATLRRLGRMLAAGGVLIVAVVVSPPHRRVSRARLVDLLRRIGRRCGIRRLSEPGDDYYRGYALGRPPASFRYVHRFTTPAELGAELLAAGLSVSDVIDDRLWITTPSEPAGPADERQSGASRRDGGP